MSEQVKVWLTLTEVSKRISVSKKLLNRAIHATDHTHLPAQWNGNRWLVKTVDADAWPTRALRPA